MTISITGNGLYTCISNWLIKTTGLSKLKVVLLWTALYFVVSISAMAGVATRFDVSFLLVLLVCALGSFSFSLTSEAGVEKEWALLPKPIRNYAEYVLWIIGGIQYLEEGSMAWLGVLILVWLGMNIVDKVFFGKSTPGNTP